MNDKTNHLVIAQTKLHEKIRVIQENTPPARVFSLVGSVLQKITRKNSPYHWTISATILAILSPLPTVILCFMLNETYQWNALGFRWIGYIELGLATAVIGYLLIKFMLKNIRTHIVNSIQRVDDVENLGIVLARAGETKLNKTFVVLFAFFWCFSYSLISSLFLRQFIGIGLTIGTLVFGFLIGGSIYLMFWAVYFMGKISSYGYNLYKTSPAHSEVIYIYRRIFNTALYVIAVWLTILTVVNAFNELAIWLAIGIAWVPTIVLFARSQNSMHQIIRKAKWATLNDLQHQIEEVHKSDLADKNNLETINRLMNYHERIRVTPNSSLDLKAVLNFINQLTLPFIGFLIANFETVISFF